MCCHGAVTGVVCVCIIAHTHVCCESKESVVKPSRLGDGVCAWTDWQPPVCCRSKEPEFQKRGMYCNFSIVWV